MTAHYADQRYYNSNAGRFYTPDPAGRKAANPGNPTSWNVYLYSNADPVNGSDPTGMDVVTSDPSIPDPCNLSLNINLDNPYNSPCGGGNGAGWGSESAIGAAVGDVITDFSSLLNGSYADSGVLANFSTTVFASDPSPVPSPVGATLTDTSDDPSDPPDSTPFLGGFPTPGATTSALPTPTSISLTLPGTNYCGPGGSGTPTNRVDAACAAHDLCYQRAGATWLNNVFGTGGSVKQSAIQACNAQICNALQNALANWPTSQEGGQATIVGVPFGCVP